MDRKETAINRFLNNTIIVYNKHNKMNIQTQLISLEERQCKSKKLPKEGSRSQLQGWRRGRCEVIRLFEVPVSAAKGHFTDNRPNEFLTPGNLADVHIYHVARVH